MNTSCQQCGAELLPQTSFCRQCGASIPTSQSAVGNEQTTRLLDEGEAVATQRLDPRPTSPGREPLSVPASVTVPQAHRGTNKLVLLAIVILVLLAGIVSTVAFMKHRGDGAGRSVDALTYPGARTVMDIVAEGGGHAVHLETPDSFEAVRDWYSRKLEPQKVVQLTSASAVMKNDKTTATIVREGDMTNILLKIVP